MALIVAPGAVDAESYASVEEAATYAAAWGFVFDTAFPAQAEAALRRATAWLDAAFMDRLLGHPATSGQALEWPRRGVIYRDAYIAEDAIPDAVKRATAEAASRELSAPFSLAPDTVPGQVAKSVEVEGAVSIDYANPTVKGQAPRLAVVEGLMRPFLRSRGAMQRMVRH